MKHRAINACGISLGALAALFSTATLAIGPDTGPLHLARSVNCATVGIYWAPNLINWGPTTRNIHQPVIAWDMQCPYCGIIPNTPHPFEPVTTCSHDVSFVRKITVADVIHAAERLLHKKSSEEKTNSTVVHEVVYK